MSLDWTEYLKLAHELAGDAPIEPLSEESRQRTAISRAYYAAFHVCIRKLGAKVPAYQNSHLAVADYFLHNRNNGYKRVGRKLDMLLHDRRRADYDDDFLRIDWIAEKALSNAREIIELIRVL